MSSSTYNALTIVLIVGSYVAVALAAAYLVAAIVGWRGPHRRRRLVRFSIFLAAFPALVATQQVVQWGIFMPSLGRELKRQMTERHAAASLVHVGDRAPSFTLTDADGREFVLDDHRGKVVLLNFFATWCGPCLEELPHLQKLWEDNRDNGDFSLLVIGREETSESVATFRSKQGYTFPMASDPEATVYSRYAKILIPRTYLVSPNGKICFACAGLSEEDLTDLKRELTKQLRATR